MSNEEYILAELIGKCHEKVYSPRLEKVKKLKSKDLILIE